MTDMNYAQNWQQYPHYQSIQGLLGQQFTGTPLQQYQQAMAGLGGLLDPPGLERTPMFTLRDPIANVIGEEQAAEQGGVDGELQGGEGNAAGTGFNGGTPGGGFNGNLGGGLLGAGKGLLMGGPMGALLGGILGYTGARPTNIFNPDLQVMPAPNMDLSSNLGEVGTYGPSGIGGPVGGYTGMDSEYGDPMGGFAGLGIGNPGSYTPVGSYQGIPGYSLALSTRDNNNDIRAALIAEAAATGALGGGGPGGYSANTYGGEYGGFEGGYGGGHGPSGMEGGMGMAGGETGGSDTGGW